MGGVYRRSRTHKGDKAISKKYRTRRRTKDKCSAYLRRVHDALKPENMAALEAAPVDDDLPGGGKFSCVPCGRHFISQTVLSAHCSTKLHKQKVRTLKEVPYTIEEAEAAGGLGANVFAARKESALAAVAVTLATLDEIKKKHGPKDNTDMAE